MGTLILKAGINNTRSKIEKIDEEYKELEGKLTSEFRRLLTKELIELKVVNNYGKEDYREWSLKHIGTKNISLDFHFNLSDISKVNGTEIIIPFNHDTIDNRSLAEILLKCITYNLKTKSRGINQECNNYRGQLLFITPNFYNTLIEICFLTNEQDITNYQTNKLTLVKELATILKQIL